MYLYPQKKLVCVLSEKSDIELIRAKKRDNINIIIYEKQTEEYKIQNNKTTYYVCNNFNCNPPTNNIEEVFS